ncbi:MAG: hypothetical protein ACOYO1_13805 [Bacteroidales bacterium]
MDDNIIQQEINELNRKLDLVLEEMQVQRRKREEVEDLLTDLSYIGKDIFQTSVIELDRAGVDVDIENVSRLGIGLIKNINTFNQLLGMLESMMDLAKDVEPIIRQMGLDAINKMSEFEQKGYIDFIKEMGNLAQKFMTQYTAEDLRRLSQNMDKITSIIGNLTQPSVLESLEKLSSTLAQTKLDDKLDNKSLYKLFKEFNSPEVRKTMSYSLRLVQSLAK